MIPTPRVWRVFPWDSAAAAGTVFTPSYVQPLTGRGWFDLTPAQSRVLYLAETPEHAVAETLQPWAGTVLEKHHLVRAGRPLALVSLELSEPRRQVANLCDPALLAETGIAPDLVASRHRGVTQPIARSLWALGYAGLRWWSRFWGDWHTWALFVGRLQPGLAFGTPERLDVSSPALLEAARLLDIEVIGS